MAVVGWVVSYIAVVVAGLLLRGWTLVILWGWFIVPVFHLPSLAIPAALGLALVVSFLVQRPTDDNKKDRTWADRLGRIIGEAIVWNLLTLGLGFVIHLFM